MANIIFEMISSLIKGDGNWKNELAIMSAEEKQKALNEIKLNNRNNTVEFAPNSMEPILCKPEDFEGDLIYDQVPSGIIIEEGEDEMERIIAENKELEEISEYLKNMYEEEVEENESYIKRIRTEVRRRTERGEEYTIGSGNLFY